MRTICQCHSFVKSIISYFCRFWQKNSWQLVTDWYYIYPYREGAERA